MLIHMLLQDYATVGYRVVTKVIHLWMLVSSTVHTYHCTMVRAVGENSFQPKIAFKTRYGLVANPLIENDGADWSYYW